MTRVLLLAATTGYQIRSFGQAADALGVRLVFASDRCDRLDNPWWDGAIPVRFHEERRSIDDIVRAFAGHAPDAVLAVGDRPTVLAALAAEAFGLSGNRATAARASRNKLAARQAFGGAGLPVPRFRTMPLDAQPCDAAADIGYPVVLKPLALSGSRGVIRADDDRALRAAWTRLRALLAASDVLAERDAAHGHALIESFVPGAEYAIEGVLTGGAFHPFAIFDKPDPLDGPFFEETIYVTPSRAAEADQQRIVDSVATAARALGLTHGPVHAECRVNGSGVYVLEVAARPIGGLCSRALRFVRTADAGGADPLSLEEVLLRQAIGEDVRLFTRESAAAGVMMIPIPRRGVFRGVQGVEAARSIPGIEDVVITAKPDVVLVPLPEGRSYLGFIFARGATPACVEQALREAHGRLEFTLDRDIPLLAPDRR